MTRESNVFQMWPAREAPPQFYHSDNIRSVRPLPDEHLNAIFGEPVNLYQSLEDQARIAAIVAEIDAADARLRRMQATVKWFAILLAYALIVYFSFQMGRGL
jgi:hypothetical protein